MKKILETLRGARKIELFLVIAAAAMLIMLQFGDSGNGTHSTEEEKRLASVLRRIDGVGSVEVMISDSEAEGVLVVAEGAGRIDVFLRIAYAVRAVTGVEISDIEILPYGR